MTSQNNPKQKEHKWTYHKTWFQIILENYSHKDNLMLASKGTGSMKEQNIGPRKKTSKSSRHLIFDKIVKNIEWVKIIW